MSGPENEVIYDKDFLKDVRRLPAGLHEKISDFIDVLRHDPFDPRLHTKPLSAPLQGMFAFRVSRDYRIGFKFSASHVIHLLAAANRDAIYQKLQRRRK